jgi:putative membrane protein
MQLLFKPQKNIDEKAILGKQNPNRVRDHLANERTYLAWMRMAISLLGVGVIVVRLRILRPPMLPAPGNGWRLGLAFSVIGMLTVWLSTHHYFAVRHDIDTDTFDPPDRWVILFSLAITFIGAAVIYYVFAAPLEQMGLVIPD